MVFEGLLHALSMIFQIGLLDLILSGDNALVIALACRGLPAEQVKKAVMIGTSGAIMLRVLLTTLAGWLLLVPFLKIAGAGLLIFIAIKLLIEERMDDDSSPVENVTTTLSGAVATVLIADLVMSMDNVVGLAAVAQGSVFYLVLGLFLSVPLLMFGSIQIVHVLRLNPMLVSVGGALLGYVAGDIAVSDPAIVGWVNTQSPALNVMVPLLCAAFVVLQARIIRVRRTQLPRPAPRLRVIAPVPEPVRPRVIAESPLDSVMAVAVVAAVEVSEPLPIDVPEGPLAPLSEAITPTPAPVRPRRTLNGPARIILTLCAIFTVSWLVYSFIGSIANGLLPKPMADSAYICPGSIATIYYRPGGSSIRIVTGDGEASGYVSLQKILWENPTAAVRDLHLSPPTELEKTNNNVVTVSGGSFSQIQCVRPH
ncbi:TerC family protein [Pseudomonas sp. CCI3.2]|uniref:TerC family protein n=2 Tax=Pseudomonas TaxID=286 RepID=UPI002AC898C2|nr:MULTISPECIES: TerC family protein [unclassified Pseudomonas]MEB0160376.1 TerC family protein [Pseudomonas sp. AH2 (2023)]MEB0078318.1 TerC family protein [Pseudomonas sp. MH10out]MEB0092279.1 TerC family protein [Pseudomonas sp. CCI4.2]MEB0101772.1 TerC family protein [Pseudomonas sp. CCI3.2]MEB0132151.1 TerC family protein [Pseudomonas sp. CCI2.4]